MDYNEFRHFADSWGLVYMLAIFLIVIAFVFRPGSRRAYENAAKIPFDETSPDRPAAAKAARNTETD
jgi:cytochrome c oxidase cbb3-type subunit 4